MTERSKWGYGQRSTPIRIVTSGIAVASGVGNRRRRVRARRAEGRNSRTNLGRWILFTPRNSTFEDARHRAAEAISLAHRGPSTTHHLARSLG